jgi:hypothetical protein
MLPVRGILTQQVMQGTSTLSRVALVEFRQRSCIFHLILLWNVALDMQMHSSSKACWPEKMRSLAWTIRLGEEKNLSDP